MMKAAIDIGSNTLLLLIAEISDGKIEVLHEEQQVPRLGKGVDKTGALNIESMEIALNGLMHYKRVIDTYGEIPVVVTATSAVRDASNGVAFQERVFEETGFRFKILSGDEEARVTYQGALSMLDGHRETSVGVIDIGGGSTEVAIGSNGELADYHSFNIGCVRFTERYLGNPPVSQALREDCRVAIREELSKVSLPLSDCQKWCGVAGTVTSLAYLLQNLTEYSTEKINNTVISRADLSYWEEKLGNLTVQEMEQNWPIVMKGRADIFMAGILILDEILRISGSDEIVVSTGGVRHGMILQ